MRDRFPWLLAVAYAAILTGLGAIRYAVHRNLVDFGIFAQTISSAFRCFCNPIEGSHWAFHFSPILYLPGIAALVWHSPYVLIVFSAMGGALVIPPVYAIVARRAEKNVARLAALVAFLYPPLLGLTFNDFHENALAPAAVLWAFWAFDAGRLRLAVLCALLAIGVKEDQAIFMALCGLAVAWRYRASVRATAGIVVACAGLIAALGFFLFIAPHAQVNPNWAPVRFYAWTQSDVLSLVPAGIAQRAGFLVLVFLPLVFLPFRSALIWLALPPFAEVLLSRMPTTFTNGSHYAGAWAGYVLAAFAFAARERPAARLRPALAVALALCVVELAVANPMHPGLNLRAVQERDVLLDRRLAALAPGADVATQEEAYTHLAMTHPFARLLPEDPTRPLDACIVLIDRDFPQSARLEEYGAAFDALAASGVYADVFKDRAIEVYRRRSCH